MKHGSTLIDMLLLTAGVVVATAILVVYVLPKEQEASCYSPLATLRTVRSAQRMYFNRFSRYGTMKQLADADLVTDILVSANSPTTTVSGWYFTITLEDGEWSCVARPFPWTDTSKNYKIGTDGIIYYNETENGNHFAKTYARE